MCEIFDVSKSGFYDWIDRDLSCHAKYDQKLLEQVVKMHVGHRKNYGAGRVYKYLKEKGFSCSRRRINRLMKEYGIRATYNGGKYAGKVKELGEVASFHLKDAPAARKPGQQWAGDMTYLKTAQGPIYMAAVLDLFTRKVVGWGFSRSHDAALVSGVLDVAVKTERYSEGCIFHSDQGSEYRSRMYQEKLKNVGMVASMSRAGTPTDNAFVESFFGTLKKELVNQWKFNTHVECVARIVDYIQFYNEERLHSGLNFMSPEVYEKQFI